MSAQTPDITIELNGSSHAVASGTSLAELLDSLELTGQRVAIEVNETVIPRSEYPGIILSHGDRVEIIRAIGGG